MTADPTPPSSRRRKLFQVEVAMATGCTPFARATVPCPILDPDNVAPLTDEQLALVKDRVATQIRGQPRRGSRQAGDAAARHERRRTRRHVGHTPACRPAAVARAHRETMGAAWMREGKDRKPIHLAAHFPGVNNTTVWRDPQSGSQIEFESFVHLAETAERGSSTSSSSPKGCDYVSTADASTTSTWSAGPTRSPCWRRSQASPTASA